MANWRLLLKLDLLAQTATTHLLHPANSTGESAIPESPNKPDANKDESHSRPIAQAQVHSAGRNVNLPKTYLIQDILDHLLRNQTMLQIASTLPIAIRARIAFSNRRFPMPPLLLGLLEVQESSLSKWSSSQTIVLIALIDIPSEAREGRILIRGAIEVADSRRNSTNIAGRAHHRAP